MANGDEVSQNGNGRLRISWERVLTVIVAVLLAYAAVTARVAVLESQQDAFARRLERIENKVDQILERPR